MALITCPFCGKQMSERASVCPQCNKSMEEIRKASQQTKVTVAPKVEDESNNLRLREEQSALQKQVVMLKEEVKKLQDLITSGEKELENLKDEKENIANSISQEKSLVEKNAENKVLALKAEAERLQQYAATLQEEAKKQQDIAARSKVELETLKSQIESAKKELIESSQMSKKDRLITWCLIAACVVVTGWIAWMVLEHNGII